MKNIIIIPARLKSKRLPRKLLLKLGNEEIFIRTYNQCLKVFPSSKIIIATDSAEIKKLCIKKKIKYLMTSKKCKTGTDRILEVSKKLNYDNYINVQGDEPFFEPKNIKKLVNQIKKNPNVVLNGYAKITKKEEYFNNSIPKVVFDENKNLLFMSRSPIPGNKNNKFNLAYKQICIYNFPKKLINKFNSKNKTQFEAQEDIEILRFIERGIKVKMIEMKVNSFAIDTPSDYLRAKKKIKSKYNKNK